MNSLKLKGTVKFLVSSPAMINCSTIGSLQSKTVICVWAKVYCEWGSGYGVGACLAALLGFESYGIEIEPSLIEESRKLAKDSNIPVTIIERDYMPEGFECYEGSGGAELIRPENYTYQDRSGLRPSYEGMEADLDEVDIFFIYPWPGEQEFVLEFFQAVAADGSLCLIYLGDDEFGLYQKTAAPFD